MSDPLTPDLSICIVSWNTRDLLDDCLASIMADPDSDRWQVIVVDNASTDDSPEMVRRAYPEAELIASDVNLGFVEGSNRAMALAQGRYLLLLNPDTVVQAGALGGMVVFMDRTPEAGAAGPMLQNGDGSLQPSCGFAPSLRSELVRKLLLHRLLPDFKMRPSGPADALAVRRVDWVTGACLFARREAVTQVGPLDAGIFMFYEDVEWCMRIARAGWKIFFQPAFRVVHLGGQSTRKNLEEMLVTSQRSLYYLFQRYLGRGRLFVLRVLTVIEMLLRTALWSVMLAAAASRREEARARLRAYGRILWHTLVDRSYWAPAKNDTYAK